MKATSEAKVESAARLLSADGNAKVQKKTSGSALTVSVFDDSRASAMYSLERGILQVPRGMIHV